MKKLLLFGVFLSITSILQAISLNVSTPNSLTGNYAYTLGVQLSVPVNQQVNSLTISFNDIQLTSNPKGYLYIDLLNLNTTGTHSIWDGDKSGDYFASYLNNGQGIALGTEVFKNKNQTMDLTFTLDTGELAALNSYIMDGIFDIGLDADCSYDIGTCKVSWTTVPYPTKSVPDTAMTGGLLGISFLSLLVFRRKLALNQA